MPVILVISWLSGTPGFTSVEKVKEVAVVDDGDGLLDAGISVAIVRKIRKYLKVK